MKFLITGGAGFIGSNCVSELLKMGHSIRVIDNLSSGKHDNIKNFLNDIEFIQSGVENYDVTRSAVEGMDYIIHLAAIPSVQYSILDPIKSNDSMVNTTLTLFKAAKDYGLIKGIVQATTAAAYGNNTSLPKKEDMIPEPLSPYAVAKLCQEYYAKVFSKIYGLKITSLRLFNVYGPNQDPTSSYSGVISIFLSRILSGLQPIIYGDGCNTRDFIYVGDVVKALYTTCLKSKGSGDVFNIGTGNQTSLNEIVELINKINGSDLKPIYLEARAGDILHSVSDISKAKTQLEFLSDICIEQGMRVLINFLGEE
ncbi:NAD-dependent epimerase/dehydratase family protein [Dehalobacter sp. CF]|jgi:Nucleoside-diphosphate-sugar epimerases|uniref:NAD-dependent epimerase/dehydratase family protein n=1 Tax=Dehalobacter sp. CF TaxID=1131462 RepID=UPI00028AD1EE|nr:NAD-dependent epimerase/dehydratase family protein [Dehalobacter sp. CF]AFV05132.1 UDP-glucose 4-epimerase [Dehalobacter sp. CF]